MLFFSLEAFNEAFLVGADLLHSRVRLPVPGDLSAHLLPANNDPASGEVEACGKEEPGSVDGDTSARQRLRVGEQRHAGAIALRETVDEVWHTGGVHAAVAILHHADARLHHV